MYIGNFYFKGFLFLSIEIQRSYLTVFTNDLETRWYGGCHGNVLSP